MSKIEVSENDYKISQNSMTKFFKVVHVYIPFLDITQKWCIYHSRTRQCHKKSTGIYTILGSHIMRSLSGTYTIARINPYIRYIYHFGDHQLISSFTGIYTTLSLNRMRS